MNENSVKYFRQKLSSGNVLGCFSKTTDSSIIEGIGKAGMDFVIIDLEHGYISLETLKNHLLAAYNAGIFPIVRLEGYDSENIGKVLDLDAGGIQIPSVSSPKEILHVIEKSKFHPKGNRGVCRFVKSADYGTMDKHEYFRLANEKLIIVQLEGKEGFKNIFDILKIDGYDVLFIGPYDLSQSLGYPGQIEHPEVVESINEITRFARKNNKIVGTFCDTKSQLESWKAKGIQYLAYSVDINILIEKIKEIRNEF